MSMSNRKTSNAAYFGGIANLPNQAHRRMVKKGFEFTLMLVGESGLGKSTLVSSLFQIDRINYDVSANKNLTGGTHETVQIKPTEVQIEERGVKLKLTIVDTPGFGESLSGIDQTEPISDYIDSQFQQYLDNESGLNRRNITDTRVHCCFYFISPHSNGLRPMDIDFMKSLHHKVNIVPLIAKADTLTPLEISRKKGLIMNDINKEQIRIYQLPDVDDDEDQTYKSQLETLKSAVPFAVVGSTETYEVAGKKVRGRLYPWGIVEIENPKHSEFNLLRNMLIVHMQDLQEVTHDLHYENYRAQILTHPGSSGAGQDGLNVPSATTSTQFRSAPTHSQTTMVNSSARMSGISSDPSHLEAKELEIQKMREAMQRMQMELQMANQAAASQSYSYDAEPVQLPTRGRKGPPPPPRKGSERQ